MTGNENGQGLRAHSAEKRRYWIYNAVFIIAVFALAFAMTQVAQGHGRGSLTVEAGIGFSAALSIAFVFGTYRIFRIVDELDRQLNYIAISVGFITNIAMVIAWFPLFFADLLGPPNAIICIVVSSLVAQAVYFWLKLRHR